jgi:hypothetical protein
LFVLRNEPRPDSRDWRINGRIAKHGDVIAVNGPSISPLWPGIGDAENFSGALPDRFPRKVSTTGTEMVRVRVTPFELRAIATAANREGVSEWARKVMLSAVASF